MDSCELNGFVRNQVIKACRQSGITYEELANKLGSDFTSLSDEETENLSFVQVLLIAKNFGKSLEWFIPEEYRGLM